MEALQAQLNVAEAIDADSAAAAKRLTEIKDIVDQLKAQIAYNNDDVKGAIALNQQAIDADALDNASHFALIYQLAQLNLMEENYEGTLAAVQKWEEATGSKTADSLAVKGNALYRLERFDDTEV